MKPQDLTTGFTEFLNIYNIFSVVDIHHTGDQPKLAGFTRHRGDHQFCSADRPVYACQCGGWVCILLGGRENSTVAGII